MKFNLHIDTSIAALALMLFLAAHARVAQAQSKPSQDGKTQTTESASTLPVSIDADVAGPPAAATPARTARANDEAAQETAAPIDTEPSTYMDVYGFAMLDLGYDIKVTDPNWFDVNRPSKLPAFPGEFGKDGNTYASVRQTRFGVKGAEATALGELKYEFEFDMFGVGIDAGQTTIRPRHYFGEIGPVLAGQTNSVFMDVDIFPNVLDYWGPNGMVFLRSPQLRYTPLSGSTTLMFALEKPGASGDAGVLADRLDLTNIHGRFQYPDLTGAISYTWKNKSYLRGAGVVRSIKIDNVATNATQSIIGWGINLSSNLVIHKDVLRLQYVVGDGIENYMNDAPVDVAPEVNFGNPGLPVKGKAVPMYSFTAYLDHNWSEKLSSALGYSELVMHNTILQTPDAFHEGQYASVNLLYSPFKSFLTGGEFQYGKRTNFTSGFNANDYRVQFSFKYSFINFRIRGKS
jgi:outer membrane DcaP-like protein